jgi:hypothetical protein
MNLIAYISILLLLLSACGQKLEGETYESSRPLLGVTSFKFERGGKVYISVMGQETEMKYEVNGNKVKISSAQGNQILTLLDDGSIDGGMAFGTLHIKKKADHKFGGTYSATDGREHVSLTFEAGGQVRLSTGGPDNGKYAKYTFKGNKVEIIGPDGKPSLLKLHEDGSLEGPDGIRLSKIQ